MHDDTQVARVYEMGKALKDGMFPVRWVQDLGYGFGYPIFNFYSPLPYYIGGFLTLIGFDALLATKIVFIIGIILAGFSMHFFIRGFTGGMAAILAGVLYLYFPYHAVNIYVRGNLDELFSYALLPLVFLGFYKIFYIVQEKPLLRNNIQWIIFSSITLALVVLSHNLSSFMLLIFIGLLIILSLFYSKNKIRLLTFYLLALFLGLLLSSFYIIPALMEMKYTNVYSQVGGGADYKDHFICPIQLWDSPWGYGGSAIGCVDGLSFRLGKSNIILFILSIPLFSYFFIKKKIKDYVFIYFSSSVLFLAASYFVFDISEPIWKTVPFMPFLQYPWRFLSFLGLFMGVVIGFSAQQAQVRIDKKIVGLGSIAVILLTLFLNIKLFQPQFYYQRNAESYINKQHLNWTTSKISDEYMPVGFSKPKMESEVPDKPIEILGTGNINNLLANTGRISADINLKENSLVKLNIAYFPAWKILINGKPQDYKVGREGLYLNLDKGASKVEARFVQTSTEKMANVLTLVGILIIFTAIIKYRTYE